MRAFAPVHHAAQILGKTVSDKNLNLLRHVGDEKNFIRAVAAHLA